ncbi:MAG: trimeric autotransporter adhesin [Aliidongia sp.]|nr:trimeric autotransporter adhesin [Aliidongia sp.]
MLGVAAMMAGNAAIAQGVTSGGFLGIYAPGNGGVSAPAFERRDVRLDFVWTAAGPGGSPSPAFDSRGWGGFSARWDGLVVATTSETYQFFLNAGGSADLLIRPAGAAAWNVLVPMSNGAVTTQASLALVAGQLYEIQLDYVQPSATGNLSLAWASPSVPRQIIEPATPIGINAPALMAGEPGNMLADVAQEASAFAGYSNQTVTVPLDVNGWPLTDASLPLWTSGREMNGTYNISFTGQATLTDWAGIGSFSVKGVTSGTMLPSGTGYDPTTNITAAQWTVSATAAGAASLGFGQTRRSAQASVGSGITGLHIMRPLQPGATQSHPAGAVIGTQFEAFAAGFTGIRFMDYLATNGNQQRQWSDRVKPGDATQFKAVSGYGWQGKGGSLENLIIIANETGKDVWINVPLYAVDDYVTKLAQLLAYGSDGTTPYTSPQVNPAYPPLNSNLKAYIEYSNEIWNSAFGQYNGNIALAQAEVTAGNSPLAYDGSTDGLVWGRRRVVERTVQLSDLFRGVWGDGGMMTRIRPVFEWQYGDTNMTTAIGLGFLEAWYDNADGHAHVPVPHPAQYYLWGGGAGWYITPKNQSLSTVSAILTSGITNPSTETDTLWATAFGLHEMGYEGGFDVGGDHASALQLAANLDPAALAPAAAAIGEFFQNGGGYPFVFDAAGATAYGLADPTINEAATPKIQAVMQMAGGARPAAQFPGHIPGTFLLAMVFGVTTSGSTSGLMSNVGDFIGFTVTAPKAGNFTITTDAPGPTVQILLDNVLVGTGSWTGPITGGLHGIRIRNISPAGTTISKMIVTAA